MDNQEQNEANRLAGKAFFITMLGVVAFAGAVYLYVLGG
jgi:hypothetical protein